MVHHWRCTYEGCEQRPYDHEYCGSEDDSLWCAQWGKQMILCQYARLDQTGCNRQNYEDELSFQLSYPIKAW